MRNSAERGMLDSEWHVTPSFSPAPSVGADAPAPSILVVVVADSTGLEHVLGSSVAAGRTVHVIGGRRSARGVLHRDQAGDAGNPSSPRAGRSR